MEAGRLNEVWTPSSSPIFYSFRYSHQLMTIFKLRPSYILKGDNVSLPDWKADEGPPHPRYPGDPY